MAKNNIKIKSQKYWEDRFLRVEDKLHKKTRISIEELKRISERLNKEFTKEQLYWISRLMETSSMDLSEAQRELSKEELKDFKDDVENYLEIAYKDNFSSEHTKELVRLSARYHVKRSEVFKTKIKHFVETFIAKEHKVVLNTIKDIYKDSYHMTTYELAKGLNVEVDLFHPNETKLEMLLKKPWTEDGIDFSERIWKNHRGKLVDSLYDCLETSFMKGDNPYKMATKLSKTFDVSKSQAQTLLRTEGAHFAEQARSENFKKLNVEKYIIVATLDMKTSDICRYMDGKVFDEKKRETGLNSPPFHPNCRTTTAPYFESLKGLSYRVARDKNGKTIKVPNDMNYEEFYKKYIESDKEYRNKEKAWKSRHSDKKQYEKYKKLGFNSKKSFEGYQKMKYNDTKEWEIVKGYGKSVQNGEISPLIGYSDFKKYHKELEDKLIKLRFSDGNEIKVVSCHFTARAMGTHDWAHPKNSKKTTKRLNHKHVSTEDIIECIEKGKLAKTGENSFVYEKKRACGISFNPKTGVLIQCNPK